MIGRRTAAEFFATPPRALRPPRALVWLSLAYLGVSLTLLLYTTNDPRRAEKMSEKDSRHYLEIAQSFAAGDFSMSYVKGRPHRQPLYPFLLALASRFGGENLIALGMVNVLLGLLSLWLVYVLVQTLFANYAVSFLIGALFVINRFIYDHAARFIMTEVPFVLLCLGVLFLFMRYLSNGRARDLLVASVVCALAYLTRPNGLFAFAAMLLVCVVYDLKRKPLTRVGWYAGAVGLFLVLTLPATWPRLQVHGAPFYHGRISNYLWADDYHVARATERILTWRDYAATHSIADVMTRWLYGFWEVFVRLPLAVEAWPLLYLVAMAGMWLACTSGDRRFRFLFLFMLLQLLPLIWGTLAARSGRLPYTVMLPFLFVFAGLALQRLSAVLAERPERNAP